MCQTSVRLCVMPHARDASSIDRKPTHLGLPFISLRPLYLVPPNDRYDAPCGAMVWTQQFLSDIRKAVPEFRYKGVDIVEHVVQANQATFSHDPLTEITVGDMTEDPVPAGFDMIFSRDALQHLTYKQIHGALRRFAESDANWTVIGHYPTSHNVDLAGPGTNHFDINLEAAPFNLKPDEVLVENKHVHRPTDHPKHLAVFKQGSLLANTDWKAMEVAIYGHEVSKPAPAPVAALPPTIPSIAAAPLLSTGNIAKANTPIAGTFDSTI